MTVGTELWIVAGAVAYAVSVWFMLRLFRPRYDAQGLSIRLAEEKRRILARDLTRAMADGAMYLVYQPKMQLRTGDIDGVEALLRWSHPVFGDVPRSEFIPVVEHVGYGRDFTLWVLRRAIADRALLAEAGHPLTVHINISGNLLADAHFIAEVVDLAGSAPGTIGLEITETAFIDNPDIALAHLRRLVERDIAVSIDDYGSGMSSLAYLKELPATELKIDKLFISGLTSSHRDPLIVRSTIDLAHALQMGVVAEGVESPATLALLRIMGCDYAQGYLISPALPVADLKRFLASGAYRVTFANTAATLSPPDAFWSRTANVKPVIPRAVRAS